MEEVVFHPYNCILPARALVACSVSFCPVVAFLGLQNLTWAGHVLRVTRQHNTTHDKIELPHERNWTKIFAPKVVGDTYEGHWSIFYKASISTIYHSFLILFAIIH